MSLNLNETAAGSYKQALPQGVVAYKGEDVMIKTAQIHSGVTITRGNVVANSGGKLRVALTTDTVNAIAGTALHTVTGSATVTQITIDESLIYGKEQLTTGTENLATTDEGGAANLVTGGASITESGASAGTSPFRITRVLSTTNDAVCFKIADLNT